MEEQIKFIELSKILEKIQNASKTLAKEKTIESLFNKVRQSDKCESCCYYLLRTLLPQLDRSRDSYGIQKNTLGKMYIKFLGLSTTGKDASKLSGLEKADFATTVFDVVKNRSNSNSSNLTLSKIHDLLDIISKNDRKETEHHLGKYVESATALEQKWFVRILLKDLRIGVGEQKILNLYHPQARELYNRHTNLKKVCELIESSEPIDLNNKIEVFQHISPMLCEKLYLTKLEKVLQKSQCYLETKMDGERFQIHMKDETFKYFSRNGFDYTKSYGKNICEGNLTPFLAKLFKINIENVIVDGEMMVWDKTRSGFRTKGENFDVKNIQIGGNLRPCFVIYDLLHLNNKQYLDRPYIERVNKLIEIFKEQIGILKFCDRVKICNKEEFMKYFNAAINNNEEGVILKKINSIYKAGLRTGSGWFKLKPDYVNGVVSDLDLLIIGGYGKEYINTYLLGICKNVEQNTYMTICIVTNNSLKLIERQKLNEYLKPHWQKEVPSNIEFGGEIPHFWIEPKKSVILQVKASELYSTSNFSTKYTLRFPRIEEIRFDKVYRECMQFEEFQSFLKQDLNSSKVKKINVREINENDLRTANKRKIVHSGDLYAKIFKPDQIKTDTVFFENFDFCILNGSKNLGYTIDNLKHIVLKHSGRIIENPSLDSEKCICIAGDCLSFKVTSLKETKKYNIVKADWLIRAFTDRNTSIQSTQLKPREIVFATAVLENLLKKEFDEYGDSYRDHVTTEELSLLLKEMDYCQTIKELTNQEIYDIEKELYQKNAKNIFRSLNGYFYAENCKELNSITLSKLKFMDRGGVILNYDELKTSLESIIIFCDEDIENISTLCLNKSNESIKIISFQWIIDCDEENKLFSFESYILDVVKY